MPWRQGVISGLARARTLEETNRVVREAAGVAGDDVRQAVEDAIAACDGILAEGEKKFERLEPWDGTRLEIDGDADETSLRLAGNKEFYEEAKARYKGLPRIWACACHAFKELTGADTLADGIAEANRRGKRSDAEVRAFLSDELGASGRAAADAAGEIFTDSGRCGGFLKAKDFDADEEAEKWFFGSAPFPAELETAVIQEAKEIVDVELRLPLAEVVSFRTWLSTPSNYATSGSSRWGKIPVASSAGPTKDKLGSKWTIPLGSSVNDIITRTLTVVGTDPPLRIIGKRETEKVRGVVADDDRRYLLGRYLLSLIEAKADSAGPMSLFWSRSRAAGWYDQCAKLSAAGAYSLPIDISKFDKDFSVALLNGVQLVVLDVIAPGWRDARPEDANSDDPALSLKGVAAAYASCMGSSYNGRVTTRGLASGLAWTAFLGSLVNYALSSVLAKWAGVGVLLRAHQGDDAAHFVSTLVDARRLLLAYLISGVPMNAKKNFVSRTKSEYLRYVSRANRVYGYFSRAVVGLLVRSPINVDPLESEVSDIMGRWGTMVARGASIARSEHWMVRELSARTGLTLGDVARVLRTPASVGGWGCAWFSLTESTAAVRVEEASSDRLWPVAGPDSAFVTAAKRSFAAAGTPRADWTSTASRLLGPQGGRLTLRAVDAPWVQPDLGLASEGLDWRPVFKEGFDPMFLDSALDSVTGNEPKRQVILGLLVPGRFRDFVARLPASVGVLVGSGNLKAPAPAASPVSDSVLSLTVKRTNERLMASLALQHNPNMSIVRRLILAAELSLRLELTRDVTAVPQYK